MRKDWADKMLDKLSLEEKDVTRSLHVFVGEKQAEIKVINAKLQRLLDSYLEQDIEREDYLVKKAELLAFKKKLEEQILKFQQTQNAWLEPMKQWIVEAANAANIARGEDLTEKKVLALKIFGSNLKLSDKKVSSEALNPWAVLRTAPPTRGSERVAGIEPAQTDWKSVVLPLNHTRLKKEHYLSGCPDSNRGSPRPKRGALPTKPHPAVHKITYNGAEGETRRAKYLPYLCAIEPRPQENFSECRGRDSNSHEDLTFAGS